jgi:hypothetical protein
MNWDNANYLVPEKKPAFKKKYRDENTSTRSTRRIKAQVGIGTHVTKEHKQRPFYFYVYFEGSPPGEEP